jgi:hypothetical protein
MLGWFSNAMMAMHDFLKGGSRINGDPAQHLIDQARGDGVDNGKPESQTTNLHDLMDEYIDTIIRLERC